MKKLYEETNIQNIANAIRTKNGENATYTTAQMAAAIESIQGADYIQHGDMPMYIKPEVSSLIARTEAVRTADSIVFMVGSDSHQDSTNASIAAGNLHAGMAMKALAFSLPLDFAAFLGDYTKGNSTTTIADGKQHFAEINQYIDEAFENLPQFRTMGNHDPLGYSYSSNGNKSLTPTELYERIGKYNDDGITVMGSRQYGYCYRDFTTKQVRVICLNTSEVDTPTGDAEAVSDTQKVWFANALTGTPTGYGIVILSHHPLDWGAVRPVSNILKAYVNGESISIGNSTVSFAGQNKSSFILTFHGHTHCLRVDNLYSNISGSLVAYDIKRIAIPNMCYARTNEYGQNGTQEYGLEYGTPGETYNKTSGTAKDTAFCVCVINPSEERVYAFCYGAGLDREIFFGTETVAVTGIQLSAVSGTLIQNRSVTLTATVLPANASNRTVRWSSSNTAIATVSNGVVTGVAEGSAVISATTEDGGFTATYSVTVEPAPMENLIDTIGVSTDTRLSTSDGSNKLQNNYATIGASQDAISLIHLNPGDVIRIKGILLPAVSDNISALVSYTSEAVFSTSTYISQSEPTVFNNMIFNVVGDLITITAPSGVDRYIRVCGPCVDTSSIVVTRNQEITTGSTPQVTNLVDSVGISAGTRLSTSDGSNKLQSGFATVGASKDAASLIHISPSDTIRIKGITLPVSNDNYSSIVVYDSSAAFSSAGYINQSTTSFSSMTINVNADLITISSSVDRYIRVCGPCSDTSVVTVTRNQEIG